MHDILQVVIKAVNKIKALYKHVFIPWINIYFGTFETKIKHVGVFRYTAKFNGFLMEITSDDLITFLDLF